MYKNCEKYVTVIDFLVKLVFLRYNVRKNKGCLILNNQTRYYKVDLDLYAKNPLNKVVYLDGSEYDFLTELHDLKSIDSNEIQKVTGNEASFHIPFLTGVIYLEVSSRTRSVRFRL